MSFVRNSVGEGKQDFREKYSYDLSPTEIWCGQKTYISLHYCLAILTHLYLYKKSIQKWILG
jgi:hypothetical protein